MAAVTHLNCIPEVTVTCTPLKRMQNELGFWNIQRKMAILPREGKKGGREEKEGRKEGRERGKKEEKKSWH
jgi:hypothetical protein